MSKWNDMAYAVDESDYRYKQGTQSPTPLNKTNPDSRQGYGPKYRAHDDVNFFTEGRKPGGFEDGSVSIGFNANKQRK